MYLNENVLTAAALCARLQSDKDLEPLSFGLYHRLIGKLFDAGAENPSLMLGMTAAQLGELGLDEEFAKRVLRLLATAPEVEKVIESLADFGIDTIGIDDDNYPERILTRLQLLAPPVLFCAGNKALLNTDSVGAVGSRRASSAGKLFASKLGRRTADRGYTLVSGGADGCDSLAEAAATAAGGSAVLFLALPLKQRMCEARYAQLISEQKLCLVSDHAPHAPFHAGYAISRNKYIYSASVCTVVCESGAEQGGSYNGAMAAMNERLGAVAAFDNKTCYGNQMLIANGARAVSSPDAVFDLRES